MSIKYRCNECSRSFDAEKGLLLKRIREQLLIAHCYYKSAQSLIIEEEQNNMIANEQQEEGKKEETSTVENKTIRSNKERRIENIIETDNIFDLFLAGY